MPFKVGVAPIRHSIKYLESTPLVFKDRVKIMWVNYSEKHRHSTRTDFEHHKGAQDFVFWNLNQIQYLNPNVQILTFKNLTPSPSITCYLEDQTKVLFDVDGQTNQEIVDRLVQTLGKSKKQLDQERLMQQKKDNPAFFGRDFDRYCICSQPGQLPCPAIVPVPKKWRGKYFYHKFEEDEQ